MSRIDTALADIDAALLDGVTDVVTDDPAADHARRHLAVPLDALFPDQGVWNWVYLTDDEGYPWEGQRWCPADQVGRKAPDPWWHLDVRSWLMDPYYQQDVCREAMEARDAAWEERRELGVRLALGLDT